MKFTVTFKTPDALERALDDAFPLEVRAANMREARKFAERYVKYGECISVEFDTETGTAKVL